MNNKKIQTYKDLVEEKERMQILLATHKSNVKESWQGVKHELKPVSNVLGAIGKFGHRKHINPAIDMGIDLVGDVLFRKILLSKADWVTRLLLPVFVKNYSSNVLGNVSGSNFFGKIRTILRERKAARKMKKAQDEVEKKDVPGMLPVNPTNTPTSPVA